VTVERSSFAKDWRAESMIRKARFGVAGLLWLAAGIVLSGNAHAQGATLQNAPLQLVPVPAKSDPQADPWPRETTREAARGATEEEASAKEEQATSGAEDSDIANLDIDWSQLNVDSVTLMTTSPPPKARAAPGKGSANEATWSSTDKPNGSAVAVKQTISPVWDARVGADMTVVRPPSTLAELLAEKAANGGNEPQSSGTAWAAATAPGVGAIWDKTALEARLDPSQDQGKLATALSKQVTLSEQYSLTLQNGYNVIQGLAPVSGLAGHPVHNYETEQSAKFSISETGTSISAGQSLSTSDDKWLRKIGAEQKIFGGFNISGSVAETALGTANKSISAGFKQSW
jgi:hypothetical protein